MSNFTDDEIADAGHTDREGPGQALPMDMIYILCAQHIVIPEHRVNCPWTKGQWITYLPTALLDL